MKVKDVQVVKILMVRDKTVPMYARKISKPEDVAKIGPQKLRHPVKEPLYSLINEIAHNG